MESSERMDRTEQSNYNRFADGDDLSTEDCDLKKLTAECEKWSLKNDLQLLTHLKQMSSDLINKTEATNHSMNNLVFNAKMHCVKVDNVINEFQMLANSQFVENRVYDEEVEDIMTNDNVPNEDTMATKPKEEEILPKIKVALNIGLSFLNDRFDCSSQSVSQNDSDDENDQILEGLISNSARDGYSQRLLPFIIGSDDFAKDNYVGLGSPEESPVIDLKTRPKSDSLSVKSVESVDSEADTFAAPSVVPNFTNHLISNMNDSDDESNDLFGSVPQSNTIIAKTISSDESDSEPFLSEEKPSSVPNPIPKPETNKAKPRITSFHDELSAVIGGRKPDKPLVRDEEKEEPVVKKSEPNLGLTLDSESSDESDSIFKVNKTKPKIENKEKNFSNLFGEEPNDDSLFATNSDKPKANVKSKVSSVAPKTASQRVPIKTSSLFDDDDDEDDDDIFASAFTRKSQPTKSIVNKTTEKSESFAQNTNNKPIVAKANSLFSDEEEDDDLFSGISSKTTLPSVAQKSKPVDETEEPIVKPKVEPKIESKVSSVMNKPKPNNNLIGELSVALKKKQLFQSSDEESDSKSDKQFSSSNKSEDLFYNKDIGSYNKKAVNEIDNEEESDDSDSLFSGKNVTTGSQINELKSTEEVTEVENKSEVEDKETSNEDFLSSKSITTLANDGLKHRAALGAKRNRRPPTKRALLLTPITDFTETQSTSKQSTDEEKAKPVAAVRTAKTAKTANDIVSQLEEQVPTKEPNDSLSFGQTSKSVASLIKSPSTEEDDIFPTQITSKNLNINKINEKSENRSNLLFEDSADDSIFSSNKTNSKKVNDRSKGLFDTSDSDDDILSTKPSNVISSIIKPSNSGEMFNDVSSTDSSLSNKSDLKTGISRPAVSLFSDSDDDDLFAAVNKSKPIEKKIVKPVINESPKQTEKSMKTKETMKKSNSLFSDSEEDSDLFAKRDIPTTKREIKVTQSQSKTNTKPVFALDDSDSDEDLFSSKPKTKTLTQNKPQPKSQPKDTDLFDDPLFASRS